MKPVSPDAAFSDAIKFLLRTDPPRGVRWVYAAACRTLEVRLALPDVDRKQVFETVRGELREVGIFVNVTDLELERLLLFEFAKYRSTGRWEGFRERELAIEAASPQAGGEGGQC